MPRLTHPFANPETNVGLAAKTLTEALPRPSVRTGPGLCSSQGPQVPSLGPGPEKLKVGPTHVNKITALISTSEVPKERVKNDSSES